MTTQIKARLGAAFLMATSAIGPGFLTQTTVFTAQLGASFGTKFEGLAVSRGLPQQIKGLYHAGSVGIIMSGWLGAINYGVIVSNEVDAMLCKAGTSIPTV